MRKKSINKTDLNQVEQGERTLGQEVDDLPHFVLESNFENSICFVDDECSKVVEDESFRVLRGSRQDISWRSLINVAREQRT